MKYGFTSKRCICDVSFSLCGDDSHSLNGTKTYWWQQRSHSPNPTPFATFPRWSQSECACMYSINIYVLYACASVFKQTTTTLIQKSQSSVQELHLTQLSSAVVSKPLQWISWRHLQDLQTGSGCLTLQPSHKFTPTTSPLQPKLPLPHPVRFSSLQASV